MNELLTFERLTKVKAIQKNGIIFDHPLHYLEDTLSTINNNNMELVIQAKNPVINVSIDANQEVVQDIDSEFINEGFYRYKIEGSKKIENELFAHNLVIGAVIAFDTNVPNIQIYAGFKAWACLNLHVFNASMLQKEELTGNIGALEGVSQRYYDVSNAEIEQTIQLVDEIKTTEISYIDMVQGFGEMLIQSKSNGIGTSNIVNAAKEIGNRRSVYFVGNGNSTTKWNILNALTEGTKKTEMTRQASKSIKMIKLINNLF